MGATRWSVRAEPSHRLLLHRRGLAELLAKVLFVLFEHLVPARLALPKGRRLRAVGRDAEEVDLVFKDLGLQPPLCLLE